MSPLMGVAANTASRRYGSGRGERAWQDAHDVRDLLAIGFDYVSQSHLGFVPVNTGFEWQAATPRGWLTQRRRKTVQRS